MKTLIIIPAFNEQENIIKVIDNLSIKYPEYDYIIVNDNSIDKTLKICKEKNYKYLNLPINLGIGGCVQAGYLYAYKYGYDIAVQHDGDGQHDSNYIKDVISPIESGLADIVIGSRFIERKGFQSTGLRRFGIAFLSKLIYSFTGVKIYDVTSGYRAINKKYIEIFSLHYVQDYPEPEAIMYAALKKANIIEVPVSMKERKGGKSSIGTIKSFYYMIKVSVGIIIRRIIA